MNAPDPTRAAQVDEPVKGLVTVALVVYNGAKDVATAIDSVLAQTYRPLEVVVVDDGSTDATWEILQRYGNRIKAVRQRNGGLPVARNEAIRHARGEFIALMDHDDICMPERVAVQVAFLQSNPEVGLCCSDFSAFDDRGPIEPSHIATYYSQCSATTGGVAALYPESGELDLTALLPAGAKGPLRAPFFKGDVYDNLVFGNFVHPPTVMVRASVIREVGLFDPEARTTCDWDWNVRVSRLFHIGHVHRALLDYRRSPSQMSGLQHRASGHWVTLQVALRMVERDPSLLKRHARRVRASLGEFAIDAAYANAESRPAIAWKCWWMGTVRYRCFRDATWRTLAKLVLPTGWIRRQRARFTSAGTRLT
jgi:glycosyltransferase involved in cell wall biosynthesis